MRWILLVCACQGVFPEPDLERMKDQPNARPYEASPFFADGRAMRPPPPNTVRWGEHTDARPSIDRGLLDRGRGRFDIYCAACHGRLGDGRSEVARNMELRPPPSLTNTEMRQSTDERFYRIIADGYGLMPSYAAELPSRDRWAVIAYVRALQLAAAVPLDTLPAPLRAKATKALP
jgi:mono/diheme cytochrome c family protein